MEEYVVQRGDTLSQIAAKKLGRADRWPEIAQRNGLRNPDLLFVGQRLNMPGEWAARMGTPTGSLRVSGTNATATQTAVGQIPATTALARGFLFVVFDQLPEVGSQRIIRKVASVPRDFSLHPALPSGRLTPAEHTLNLNPSESPFLSASNKPFAAPSIEGKPLLIDVAKAKAAGAQIYSVQEVVADLRRFAAENPGARTQVEKLIWAVQIEGEVLVKGGAPAEAVGKVSAPHDAYIRTAEDVWAEFKESKINKGQLDSELATLEKAYAKAKIVGRVGRVLMVVGVIFTVKDVAGATQRSVQQQSFKPVGAEAIRQIGGWGGAIVGGKFGFGVGALFGIETGPGAIVTGAIGAVIFGALGYFGADLIADQVSRN